MKKEELLELKSEIEETSGEITKLEARKLLLMEQLEKDWKIKTVADGLAKIQIMEKSIETLDGKIEKASLKLDEQLDEVNAA